MKFLPMTLASLALSLQYSNAAVDTRLQPIYHTPGANAVGFAGDPNGMFYYAPTDTFHFFWQCSDSPGNGDIEWCHATSSDFAHWEHQPKALIDKGTFSGAATQLEDGSVVMLNIVTSLNWAMYTSRPDDYDDAGMVKWNRTENATELSGFTDVSGGTLKVSEPVGSDLPSMPSALRSSLEIVASLMLLAS